VSQYEKGKTNLDFTEARDSEWQWHQLGHVQVCTLLQTDNHASTPPLRGPIYKIFYDLSYDYRKFIVRSTYDSDLKRVEISLGNIMS